MASEEQARLTAWVRGRVQGVGFRWWTRARALELGLAGSATNLDDGRVQVVAEGPRASCEALLELLREEPSTRRRPGAVQTVVERWSEVRGVGPGFLER
ncbi:MAG: acylphosphatase [Motilibacteraceae bacterium]